MRAVGKGASDRRVWDKDTASEVRVIQVNWPVTWMYLVFAQKVLCTHGIHTCRTVIL